MIITLLYISIAIIYALSYLFLATDEKSKAKKTIGIIICVITMTIYLIPLIKMIKV